MSKPYHSIIIGQGLAGSILAYRLIQQGERVLVIDNNHHGSSSKVAAGIINPITGYRLITNTLFSRQRKVSLDLYQELESLFQKKLISELTQYRLLKSAEQKSFWHKRQAHPTYQDYIGHAFPKRAPFIDNEFGVVEILRTLRVHTTRLLAALQHWLIEKNSYVARKIDYKTIEVSEESIKIDNLQAHKIIFCEGFQAIHNPWWKHLPFKLSKGEILRVRLNHPINAMLNWRQWLIPDSADGSEAMLGANYEWGDFSCPDSINPSIEAKDYLQMRLQTNTHLQAKVIEQNAGIRPTPTHRYPYIGSHTQAANVFCFNGFGSKGCHTIPYYSEIFVKHLVNKHDLPEDVTKWL